MSILFSFQIKPQFLGASFLVVFFSFSVGAGDLVAQNSSQFNPQKISPETSKAAVWLSGIIEETESEAVLGRLPSHSISANHLRENITLGHEQPESRQSFDTTKLAAYQDDSSIIGRSLNDAESVLAAPIEEENKGWVSWKSTSVSGAWLPGSGDKLGTSNLNVSGKVLFPEFPLAVVTPSYQMYFLNGPDQTDLPGTLHSASVNFTGYIPFSDRWVGQVSVAPGVRSDFQTGSSQQFRLTGSVLMLLSQSKQTQWIFGVAYLDREDVSLLPLAGVTWSPSDCVKVELIFPRPRIKWQFSKMGDHEKWGYVGAEFTGGSWAIERANGTDDVVTLREYRLLGGVEHQFGDARSWFWETGIVMGRSVEYSSGLGDYTPNTTLVLSGGITF